MRILSACFRALLLLPGLCFAPPAAATDLRVAASLAPVHSLASGVIGNQASLSLLIPAGQSEHSSAMRPSMARAIFEATTIFRIARGFEAALDRPIDNVGQGAMIIELARAPGINLLAARLLDEDAAPSSVVREPELYRWADLHIWLDPHIAKFMAINIAQVMIKADEAHADQYAANRDATLRHLDELDAHLKAELAPIAGRPFVVFHDSYQYLIRRYHLNEVGRVAIDPERPPGAGHLQRLRDRIETSKAVCAFTEPQFEPRLLDTLTQGLSISRGTLDPLGNGINPGPDLYFHMMENIGASLVNCLSENRK